MFSDPLTLTVNSVAKTLPRILIDGPKATYQMADQTFTMSISHQVGKDKRIRSVLRVEQKAIVTNPVDSSNDYDTLVYYFVIDRPSFGFSITQVEQLVAAVQAFTTTGVVDKLFGQEI